MNRSNSKTQTFLPFFSCKIDPFFGCPFLALDAVIYVRGKEQKQKQRSRQIYFRMNNSNVDKGCSAFDRKIRLGCPKQIKLP